MSLSEAEEEPEAEQTPHAAPAEEGAAETAAGETENESTDIEDEENGHKAVAGDSSDGSGSSDDGVKAPEKKRGKGRVVLNIILVILILLLLCELAIVGVKFLMPDSAAAQWIDSTAVKVIQWASTKF